MQKLKNTTIMKKKLISRFQILGSDHAWYESMSWMMEEPFSAVEVEAVVDLVGQSGGVVLEVDHVPGQIQPFSAYFIGVGEYFVARVVPIFVPSKLWKKSDLRILF